MIAFLREVDRTEFHKLPIEEQKEWLDMAAYFMKCGHVLTITGLDKWSETQLEITIRIDKKVNTGRVSVGD